MLEHGRSAFRVRLPACKEDLQVESLLVGGSVHRRFTSDHAGTFPEMDPVPSMFGGMSRPSIAALIAYINVLALISQTGRCRRMSVFPIDVDKTRARITPVDSLPNLQRQRQEMTTKNPVGGTSYFRHIGKERQNQRTSQVDFLDTKRPRP